MVLDPQIENIEIQLLLEAIFLRYGYDFRSYSRASIKRRVAQRLERGKIESISQLQHRILHDEAAFRELLYDFSINVTEMFRDPDFYQTLRKVVLPRLREHPYIKIWHAGCATGEEAYSMAILLSEEGLYERTQIYATDFNEVSLTRARDGIYPIERIKEYTENYQRAGGKKSLSDYYTARYDHAILDAELKRNIVFSDHNLATDTVFGEMNLVLCRNVLIYFTRDLQDRVLNLFYQSLAPEGILALGSKETVRFSKYASYFADLVPEQKIYQKAHDEA